MFSQKREVILGRDAIVVSNLGYYSLKDTLECGQCFRHELICESEDYIEYMMIIEDFLIIVGQRQKGELIFYDIGDEVFSEVVRPYFSIDTDYEKIREQIIERCTNPKLVEASEAGRGIAILKQDPWQTLFSFIISQNNNIPRIRKIIKRICAGYGTNISIQSGKAECPLKKGNGKISEEVCKECGCCYSFPTPEDVLKNPSVISDAKVGFRYNYLIDSAEKVSCKEVNLDMIAAARSYEHTLECLMKIKGVGPKVASCVALFGFGCLDAFPIDVWIKRAIDEYFDGNLDHTSFGRYAGIAQQYIFHYARNVSKKTGL